MGELVEITRIQKNDSTDIVFSLTEYEGNHYIDIREYVTSARYKGWTKKGYRFRVDIVTDLVNGLKLVESFVQKENWIYEFEELEKLQQGQDSYDKSQLEAIQKFINSSLGREPDGVELCQWVDLCYSNKKYAEACQIFKYIDGNNLDPNLYAKTKKIAKVCEINLQK